MQKFRTPQSRQQLSLLPRSVDEFVPSDDTVRYFDLLVDELDLTTITELYSVIGRPGYSPRVLTKILLYGKIRGIRSSRELARACRENLRFIFLAQNEKPDFRTISDFRKRFLPQLGEILKQTVSIGIREGFIDLEHVAIDGTKIRANASAKSFQSQEKLERYLAQLEESLQEDVKREEDDDDSGGDEPKLPQELTDRRKLAERVREALSAAKNKKQVSLTDGDATFMESRGGCFPSYNGQLAVDEKSQMIVGAKVSTAGSDHGELIPMLEEIESTTGSNPQKISTDKGYRSSKGIAEVERRKITGFVALQKDNHQGRIPASAFTYDEQEDEYVCPAGQSLVFIGEKKNRDADVYKSQGCGGCLIASDCLRKNSSVRTIYVSWYAAQYATMQKRMASQEAKKMMRARAKTVEPVFGWLKTHRNLKQFIARGLQAVGDAWNFEAAAINIFRIMKLRAQAT